MQRILNTLLLISIIIFPLTAFSLLSDQHSILIGFAVFAFLSLIRKKRLEYSDTNIIFGIILAISMGVILNYSVKDSGRFFHFVATLFYGNISLISIFFASIIISFFKSNKIILALNSAFAVSALFFMSDLGYGISKEHLLWIKSSPFENFDKLFLSLCLVEFIIIIFIFMNSQNFKKIGDKQYSLFRKSIIATALLVTICFSYFLVVLHLRNTQNLRAIERALLNYISKSRNSGGGYVFNRDPDLSRSFYGEDKDSLENIILRVYNNKSGLIYLKTDAYDSYYHGIWRRNIKYSKKLNIDQKEENGYTTFYTDKTIAKKSFTIYPSSYYRKSNPPAPKKSNRFELVAEKMTLKNAEVYEAKDWDITAGYKVYYNTKINNNQNFDPKELFLDKKYKKSLLTRLLHIVGEEKKSHKEIISKIIEHFSTNYTYSLGPQPKQKLRDPILNFLDNRKSGHCEMFASSAVLMLRAINIPARYVTGFVCIEENESREYNVVRSKHAHAWAEAYLESEKRWVKVEATPPSGIPDGEHQWDSTESFFEKIKNKFNKFVALLKQGYFARAIIEIVTPIWNIIIQPIFIFCFILIMIARFFIKKAIKKKRF